MFRPSKIKKRVIRVSRQDEEDDNNEPLTVPPKRETKRPRPVVRSFANDEEEEELPQSKRGYGGQAFPSVEENKTEEHQDAGLNYDKGTLEKLKSEQRYRQQQQDEEENRGASTSRNNDVSVGEAILTGDEAFQRHDENDTPLTPTKERDNKSQNSTLTTEIEDDEWEARVARRAGVAAATGRAYAHATSQHQQSLDQLRIQLSGTMKQLALQEEDLNQAYKRRLVEVEQCREETAKHEKSLAETGTALEYYQGLRLELAQWVGALRNLNSKLVPINEAFGHVQQEEAQRLEQYWMDWENDVVRNLGDSIQVLGRQPELDPNENEVVVDEFGRNVKSRQLLEREKRFNQRRVVRSTRGLQGDESDSLTTQSEREEWKQRRDALLEAVRVALQEIDESFTQVTGLVNLFTEWAKQQPEDYQNCHAGMSLADLASVLIQVDLCLTHNPLSFRSSFPSYIESLKAVSGKEGNIEESPLYRTIDKVLIPAFEDALQQGAYNIQSSKQSGSMASYLKEILRILPVARNILVDKVKGQLVDYLGGCLRKLSVPILASKEGLKDETRTDAIKESLEYTSITQVHRIRKILTNIFIYWVPILGDRLAEIMLDFLSSTLLFLLSSLDSDDVAPFFLDIWKHLQSTGWLDQPENMVASASLRAAAQVYSVESEN
jgi:hypothetical protein